MSVTKPKCRDCGSEDVEIGRRAKKVRELLESRLLLGLEDRRWDNYDAVQLIREAQEELIDAVLYLEKLIEVLGGWR